MCYTDAMDFPTPWQTHVDRQYNRDAIMVHRFRYLQAGNGSATYEFETPRGTTTLVKRDGDAIEDFEDLALYVFPGHTEADPGVPVEVLREAYAYHKDQCGKLMSCL